MTTSQLPFLMKCPVPESRDENQSFRSIPKSQPTLFTPTGTCYELQTSTLSYAPLTLPYQSRDVATKCHNCSCCNQEARRWSMALQKNQMEKRDDFIPKVTHLSQDQFSRHRIFHEARAAEENARETAATATSGKRTRTAFTPIQLLVLETAFEKNHYVVGMERKQLAIYLKLTEQQVKVWYQNRRTKYKKNIGQNF